MNKFYDGSVRQAQLPQAHAEANSGNTVYPTSYNGAHLKSPAGDDRFVVEWQLDGPEAMSSAANFPSVEAPKVPLAKWDASPRSGLRQWDEFRQVHVRLSAVVFAIVVGVATCLLAAFAMAFFP